MHNSGQSSLRLLPAEILAEPPRFVITGGGTGGHVAPAIALAEELRARYGSGSAHILCGDSELERAMLRNADLPFTPLALRRPRGRWIGRGLAALSIAGAVPAARALMRGLNADAVLCTGGYAALPGAAAAALLQLPVFCLEANAAPGRVTRLVARAAEQCFAHMPLTRPLACPVDVTGNPVRRAFVEAVAKADARRALALDAGLPSLLVAGGSQGAQAVNLALFRAGESLRPLAGRMQVLHISGAAMAEQARSFWRSLGVRARVTAFTHNTATWFAASDLALTRAGAGVISELLCVHVPMLLVPYPHAADDHQTANARWVASHGAAVLAPQETLTPARVVELLEQLLLHEPAREKAAAAARALAKPNCAAEILDRVLAKIGLSEAAPTAEQSSRVAA
jgi:UDP-N-acetylglucosamine--N-acetylmuramyl-(pentapeptide) pyrophosphoryl-undecaprenol N-acetylglucosamine transferase